MSLVPQRACEWADDDDHGKVVVLQPRYGSGILGRLIQPRLNESKKHIRIPLEERGTFLWREMDGKLTVWDLVAAFSREFEEEIDTVPERVATYLYQMADNKLISFVNLNI